MCDDDTTHDVGSDGDDDEYDDWHSQAIPTELQRPEGCWDPRIIFTYTAFPKKFNTFDKNMPENF